MDLMGKDIASLWIEPGEREQFIDQISKGQAGAESEVLFRARDGTVLRCVLSAVLVTRRLALCSVVDITSSKIADEEIRQTLEDLEKQVKARTAHLEKINADLRAEILERRHFESIILSGNKPQLEDVR
jgi:C4-dicarboxylate-specific signal transduction histidine kinase